MMSSDDETQLDELTKFGILAIVLVGVVLIVALSRPLIFGHIVPVVMGEGLELPSLKADLPPPVLRVPAIDEAADPEVGLDVEAGDAGAAEQTDSAESSDLEETSSPADLSSTAAETIHVVKSGETLTVIARQYGVSMQQIVEANGISSPDRIRIGDELAIPQP